jgi:hypothetical protein
MKPYLCIESDKEVVRVKGIPDDERSALYFVLNAESLEDAEKKATELGAKAVRVLTKKEIKTEAEDGSYDVDL